MNKIVLSMATVATLATASMANDAAKSESGFFDRIHAKGDLRLRQEVIKKDGIVDKNRERYRFRYTVDVDVMDNLKLETGISSGKYNPTSGNVTFANDDQEIQDYFVDKLKLDIFDIKYSFDNSWVRVGKSKHHVYRPIKTQLVWDNDIRLEGVNYGYKDDNTMVRAGINQVHREKGSKDGDDINIFIAQYVNTQKLDNTKLNLGAGYWHYDDVKGNTDPYGDSAGSASVKGFKGNSYDAATETYLEDYQIAEVFAEAQFKDVMGKPFKIAAIVAHNFGASDDNLGWDISAQYGKAKKVGQWQVAATYRDIEKDAVFGAHNDSDFSGGGTNSNGYYGKIKYKFAKNVDVAGWWNWSETGDNGQDYYRHQLDVILKF